jgi:hypothetical protein
LPEVVSDKPNIWKIEHKGSRVLNWEMAEYINYPEFSFEAIYHRDGAKYIGLYKDLVLG